VGACCNSVDPAEKQSHWFYRTGQCRTAVPLVAGSTRTVGTPPDRPAESYSNSTSKSWVCLDSRLFRAKFSIPELCVSR
jgi:hypothetical protein